MTDPSPNLESFLAQTGERMTFTLMRSELARAGEEQFTTFSTEAMTVLGAQMQMWATSRLLRTAADMDSPPEAMSVKLCLTESIDGTPEGCWNPELQIRWHRTWPQPVGAPNVKDYSSQSMVALGDRMRQWVTEQLVRLDIARMPQELRLTLDVRLADYGSR